MVKLSPKGMLVVAGVFSLLTVVLLYVSLPDDTEPVVSTVQTVVVAAKNIAGRTQIAESDVKLVEVSKDAVKEGTMMDAKAVIGTMTKLPITAGDQINEKSLALSPGEGGLAGIIPVDRRAFTIAISDVSGVAGFVRPGDYVDILAAMQAGESGNIISQVILQDIQVLAMGKDDRIAADSASAEGKSSSGGTVTLAVTLDEAARLNLFKGDSALALALRPFNLKGRQIVLGRNLSEVMGSGVLRSKPAATSPQAVAPISVPRPESRIVAKETPNVPLSNGGITVYRGVTKEVVQPVR